MIVIRHSGACRQSIIAKPIRDADFRALGRGQVFDKYKPTFQLM
jgi:hypothetical protein